MIKLSSDLDTDQKVIMHVPSDPSVMPKVDETLRIFDLITDISFTDKPKDYLLDSEPMNSDDLVVIPKGGILEDLETFRSRECHTHV
uniref:Uncharacterized protein n=1 Tax=Arion vulgaris TaxID=1028688 RepID=A0A0B6Y1R8_9EUPU